MTFNFRHTFFLFILTNFLMLSAQDSLGTENKISLTSYILPLSLITVGSAISGSNFEKDLQSDIRNAVGNDFHFGIDDYTLFVPIGELYLFDLIGFKAKNNFFDKSKYLVIANLSSQITVSVLKNAIDKTRPNLENRRSFPSGHTNIAFTNATVLYHEYKDSNIYIAYSGFVFAAATGALRIMNNNHWTGDVLAGAGIGILCANLVYRFEPLKNWHPFGLGERKTEIGMVPQFGNDIYGLKITVIF